MVNIIQVDFGYLEEKAKRMSTIEIHYALVDIVKTLPYADAMDRVDGGNRGGRYRDEACVLRLERTRRITN